MSMDISELSALSVDLGRASGKVAVGARGVIAKAALNIKNDSRRQVSQHPSWKHIAATLNYDITGVSADGGVSATVGYDDVGQGELAGIYEFGSSRRAPHPTLFPAAEREVPRLEAAMTTLAAKAITAKGLF